MNGKARAAKRAPGQYRARLPALAHVGVREGSREESHGASVYDRLKLEILTNRLRPGVKLTHQSIAELLGVSRTPVREALERLFQEGYVARIPRRGFFVAEIPAEEVRDLYRTREALEIFQLKSLCETGISPGDLVRLRSINDRYASLILQELTHERLLVDREFHVALAGLVGNAYLVRMLDSIFERLILKRRIEGMGSNRGTERHREHVLLLNALEMRNYPEARRILKFHIRGGCERLLQHLKAFDR